MPDVSDARVALDLVGRTVGFFDFRLHLERTTTMFIYIYIYVCVCVCACARAQVNVRESTKQHLLFTVFHENGRIGVRL